MTDERPAPRIVEIVKGKQQGKNYTEIARKLEISRKTVYNLRGTDSYMALVEELYNDLMNDIARLEDSPQVSVQLEVLKEKGRMVRALLPSLSVIQHRKDTDDKLTAQQITHTRKRKGTLVNDIMEKFIPQDRHKEFMIYLEKSITNV